MNNKKIKESFNSLNQDTLKSYLEKIGKGPDESPTKRIFPPKSILFETKEDAKSIEKKYSYNTLNSFKPKLQSRAFREYSTMSKKNGILQNSKNDQKKKVKKAGVLQKQFQKTLESEFKNLHQERKLKLAARQLNDKQFSRDPFNLKMSANLDEKLSPYAKYSANWFPKKNLKEIGLKNKIFNQNRDEYIIDFGDRLKTPIIDQLQDIDSRLSQFSSPNILEVMTIFSIKDQKKANNAKHDFIRKKTLFKSLVPDKQLNNKSKKKEYRQNQVEIDTNTDKIYFKKIHSFLSFLSKVNFSNNMPINNIIINQRYNGEKIKVFVGKGNNKYLIIALLRRRFWFQVTNKITKDTKFIWTQNSIKNVHSFQSSKVIQKKILKMNTQAKQEEDERCSKQKLLTLINPEQSNLKLYKSYVDGILIHKTDFRQEDSIGNQSMQRDMKSKLKLLKSIKEQRNKKLFINNKKAEKAEKMLQNFKIITKTKLIQHNFQSIQTITNHIPHNSFIGSKKALFYTMEHYYRHIKNIDPFTIIPKTYHFKSLDDEAYSLFLQRQKKVNEKSIWIVKPGQCSNRGNGIYLMRAGDISRKLLKKQLHDNGQLKTTIVQSYIMDPLLYNGRKFDIRHYMMVTIVNGQLKAYWYREGYLRTSSQFFSLQNLSDSFIHLTNDAIQKTSQKYGRYQPGNKLSYSEFQRYLDNAFTKSNVNFRDQILSEMKQIATDVIKANYLNLDKERKMNNFQIFGMDFMIDSKFKPWLIEINSNPCLEISCHLLSRIIPIMVEHSLRLGLDPLILPPSHYPPNNRYYLSDNFIENLRYEIIFDEEQESCLPLKGMSLNYDFQFDEPEDEYQNEGTQIDLAQLLD